MFPVDQFIILTLLAFVGDPLRRLMSTYLQALRMLDIFQVAVFDFYMGGFIFFILASIPLGLFTPAATFLVIGFFSVISLVFLVRNFFIKLKNQEFTFSKIIERLSNYKLAVLIGIGIITMFVIVMWIEAEATSGILFGNVHDASLFSMLSTVISQNRMIPATLSPFESSGIIYPQGFTVILTFASYVLNSGPENMILVLTTAFSSPHNSRCVLFR